jgi:uncharacterized protein (TIGR02246 family)
MAVDSWINAYADAWRLKDAEALAGLFTADARYFSSPTRSPHVGRQGIMDYWRRATRTQSDLELRFGEPVVDGNRAAVEWWATMRDPEWRPEAPNDWVTLPGCLIVTFAPDWRCKELREYWNALFGERQGAPDGWGH